MQYQVQYQPGSMVATRALGRNPIRDSVQNPDVAEVLQGLATTLANAEQLLGDLESAGSSAGDRASEAGREERSQVARLTERLEASEIDRRELTRRLVEAERRGERLMTLYVATYHLHADLDPTAVERAIAEIAVDLLGAQRFALLLKDGDDCRIALERGLEQGAPGSPFAGGRYAGGHPLIDATLADGSLRQAQPHTGVVAVIPLRLGEETAGALVLFELLEQKRTLTPDDRDLLDLLAAHAAAALAAAHHQSSQERRLRTLHSLVELARPL
jgi:nitrate/nitrite-specific signal transduction histidine kinase